LIKIEFEYETVIDVITQGIVMGTAVWPFSQVDCIKSLEVDSPGLCRVWQYGSPCYQLLRNKVTGAFGSVVLTHPSQVKTGR
jgi:hypothetical protein